MAPPNELSLALTHLDWSKATAIAQSNPSLASVWIKKDGFFDGLQKSHCLALHQACLGPAPKATVRAILSAHPDAARTKESAYARLPLHCACRTFPGDPDIVALLLQAHRGAALVPDAYGRLPLHYALSNPGAADDRSIWHLLLSAQPAAAQGVDQHGWTPLHVACATGNRAAVAALLHVYPAAVILRTEKGSTPSMCLAKNMEQREQVKEELRRARQKFDKAFVNPLTQRKGCLLEEAADVALV